MKAIHVINPIEYEKQIIHLYSKYVDVVITAITKLKPKVIKNRKIQGLIWDPEKEKEDLGKNIEEISIEEFSKMAGNI